MKPGELVYIFNFSDGPAFTRSSPRIGLVVGHNDDPLCANPILILVNGEISGHNVHELMRVSEHIEAR